MSSTKSEAILDYFEIYRQKKREHQHLMEQIARTKELMEKQRYESQKMSSELRSMQRIMTTMIDADMDPVEVKLRSDIADLPTSMWNDMMDSSLMDEVTLSIAGNTGPIGAQGAISTITWPAPSVSSTITAMMPQTSATKISGGKYSLLMNNTP